MRLRKKITMSRSSTLWSHIFILLNLANFGLFIDPQNREDSGSESKLVEVRVKPPAGFQFRDLDSNDLNMNDSKIIVRTEASVSEKIGTKKPFINVDLTDEKLNYNEPKKEEVVMVQQPKPTKEAFIKNGNFTNLGVVVSIKKKESKDNGSVYIIKKKKKVEEVKRRKRPNFDPRKRSTTTLQPHEETTTFEKFEPTPLPMKKEETTLHFSPLTTTTTENGVLNFKPQSFELFKGKVDEKTTFRPLPTPLPLKSVVTFQEPMSTLKPRPNGFEIMKENKVYEKSTTLVPSTIEDIFTPEKHFEENHAIETMPTPAPLISSKTFEGINPNEAEKVLKPEPRSFEILKKVDEKSSRALRIVPTIRRNRRKFPKTTTTKTVVIPLRPPPPPPPGPKPTFVVKPLRPQVPSKIRLFYNKKKRKVQTKQKHHPVPPKLKGYEKTIEAFESGKVAFTPNPPFEDKPIQHSTSQYYDPPTTYSDTFHEEEVTIPQFQTQPNYFTNLHSDFGLKLETTPSVSTRRTNFNIKVNPIGVVGDDSKWHPVSHISSTTIRPLILEGSAKTIGDFVGKTKTTEDSVAKLLVKDPYEEPPTIITEKIDKFIPESFERKDVIDKFDRFVHDESEVFSHPYKTNFEPWRISRKLELPVIKNNQFPGIIRHISTYGRSLSISEDLVDFGAATGGQGAFGWYSDHPVAINEGIFAR